MKIGIVTFSDVQSENIQKSMTCDTTIYRGALKHYNNIGKAQTARKVTMKVTTR
jgi:hypothetical protein